MDVGEGSAMATETNNQTGGRQEDGHPAGAHSGGFIQDEAFRARDGTSGATFGSVRDAGSALRQKTWRLMLIILTNTFVRKTRNN